MSNITFGNFLAHSNFNRMNPQQTWNIDKNDIISSLISVLRDVSDLDQNDELRTFGQISKSNNDIVKSVMMTLHFLFPHELIPALDLLDRNLVNHLMVQKQPLGESDVKQPVVDLFYVQSASAVTEKISKRTNTRYKQVYNPSNTFYEVRIDSWNCSCPAFAFSAFKQLSENNQISSDEHQVLGLENINFMSKKSTNFKFGGTATTGNISTAICKHILAVSLIALAPRLFSTGLTTKEVTIEEIAGWAAGWGDGG